MLRNFVGHIHGSQKQYRDVVKWPCCHFALRPDTNSLFHEVTKKSAKTQKEERLAALSLNSAEKLPVCVADGFVSPVMCVVLATHITVHCRHTLQCT